MSFQRIRIAGVGLILLSLTACYPLNSNEDIYVGHVDTAGLARVVIATYVLGNCLSIGPRYTGLFTLPRLACYAQTLLFLHQALIFQQISFLLVDRYLLKSELDPVMPILLQVPNQASNPRGSFAGQINGDLVVQDHGSCIDSGPQDQLCAEPGHKILSIELPESAKQTLQSQFPTASFDFQFDLGSQQETQLRLLVAVKANAGGKTIYVPVIPPVSDFADAPAMTLPASSSLQSIAPEIDQPLPDADFVNIIDGGGYQIDSGISGSWYDPDFDGEGWNIQVISPEQALLYWFSYDTTGNQQAWFYGVGDIVGNKILFPQTWITSGGRFGAQFDPAQVSNKLWGSMAFVFDDCESGYMVYGGDDPYQSGEMHIERITSLSGHPCTAKSRYVSKAVNSSMNGPYYDISHNGEGWLLEILDSQAAVAYWFTYDSQGNQAWFVGVGQISGDNIQFDQMYRPTGAAFGPNSYDPNDVVRQDAGSMQFTFTSCSSGNMSYDLSPAGFGTGSLALQKIVNVDGDSCPLK